MEKKIRTDQSGDGSRLPYGWNKGDTCVMITNKAKKSTSEYIVENLEFVAIRDCIIGYLHGECFIHGKKQ